LTPSGSSSTPPSHPSELIVSTLHLQDFAGYQRFGNHTAGMSQNPAVSLPGYFHQIGGGFLVQTFKIA
jgi:hypothetical protein